jgi:hypothetical protein
MHKCPQKECGYMEVIDPNYGKVPMEAAEAKGGSAA